MWSRPCGKVSFAEAVAKVDQCTKEDDDLIRRLGNPKEAERVRHVTKIQLATPDMPRVGDTMTEMGIGPGAWRASKMLDGIRAELRVADEHPDRNPGARLAGYRNIPVMFFRDLVIPPGDPDERDEYDLLKRKLERRISDLAGDPDTICGVAERYLRSGRSNRVFGRSIAATSKS